ncbi:hypothetical protein HFN78_20950 [Rhizobium laguerreae]|uniref:hypothetical protein n=1 Tax=Rhizobium laguerreae TaxID=1076926 RepID=UPI001C911107|nr:hypothetical protein [Rhizobium laguerreae]MBY3473378.1 hypothetical protein [Rhizobium laguerreae]MBY3521071.1 hypothetical protein [Rhizobium laguerreae]
MHLHDLTRGAASAARLRGHILRSGYTLFGQKVWTEGEDLICRLFYPDYFALRQILYTRTRRAIRAHCQILGLCKTRRTWGPLDKMRLKKLYPTATREEICAAFPDIEWENICAVARYYGYRRKKKPYKITGVPALDAVRVRCYDVKINMRELDEDCRTKKYFQKRGYKTQYPNFRAINRAASYLGGYLDFHFPPET